MRQWEQIRNLAANSDVVAAQALDGPPPTRYLIRYDIKTLVFDREHGVRETRGATLVLWFPPEYLRGFADPTHVLTLIEPERAFLPNAAGPAICVGPIAPGTQACELLHRAYEVLVLANFTLVETNALNPSACRWVREHLSDVPLERRPLRRRAMDIEIETAEA